MARFDESKVINALHFEKVEIGKKYYFKDSLYELKVTVEDEDVSHIGELTKVFDRDSPFQMDNAHYWELIYPYEEPPKKRMTIRQFAEWLMKGNGEYTFESYESVYATYSYRKCVEDYEVESGIKIRSWDSDEWVEPTLDIYERDCKGSKE